MKYFFILLLSIALFSCQQQETTKENEEQALTISNSINDSLLNIFKDWNYFSRGGDNWERLEGDSVRYTVNYQTEGDTTHLYVYKAEWFAIEFECNYLLNHSKYYIFGFAKYNDSLLYIVGAENNGRDALIESNLKFRNVFKTKDPFSKIRSLNELKNKLNVHGIAYMKKDGGFFQFFLSAQTILAYLPANAALSEIWTNEFAKGKLIKPQWNLRRLN